MNGDDLEVGRSEGREEEPHFCSPDLPITPSSDHAINEGCHADVRVQVIHFARGAFICIAYANLVGVRPFGLVKGEFRDGERWTC